MLPSTHFLPQACEVQGEKQRHFLGSDCCGQPEPRCAVLRKQAVGSGGWAGYAGCQQLHSLTHNILTLKARGVL